MKSQVTVKLCSLLNVSVTVILKCFLTLEIGVGGGTQWHRCLRHCATHWNVVGLIPDGVLGNYH